MAMISVVLPAYQEEENLAAILPALQKALQAIPHEILVVDTQKKMDGTEAVCRKNEATYLQRTGGDLYGDAIRTGFAQAAGDYIAVMDADGSHDPQEIPRMYSEAETGGWDLVIGSRYCKGGASHNGPILKLMSWMLNVSYRLVFGLKVKDVSNSFRLYRAEQLKKLTLVCDNFDIVEEIIIRLKHEKPDLRIKEIPIYFNKRNAGRSKRDLGKFIISYLKTMWNLYRITKTAPAAKR